MTIITTNIIIVINKLIINIYYKLLQSYPLKFQRKSLFTTSNKRRPNFIWNFTQVREDNETSQVLDRNLVLVYREGHEFHVTSSEITRMYSHREWRRIDNRIETPIQTINRPCFMLCTIHFRFSHAIIRSFAVWDDYPTLWCASHSVVYSRWNVTIHHPPGIYKIFSIFLE